MGKRLTQIATRTGDDGTTALGSGRRVAKYDLRVECYGTLDETNAAIGLARVLTGSSDPTLDAMLARIQNDLFDLGADLATPGDDFTPSEMVLRIVPGQSEWLETRIDAATERPVVGRGAVLYPEHFPNAVGPEHPSAAALCAVVTERRFEILDPEPLYLRRPDAVEPGRPKRVS